MNATQAERLKEAEAQLEYEATEHKIRVMESLLYRATADAVLRESAASEYVTPDIIARETGWGNGRALKVSTIDDYKDGQMRPVYENERDLQEIRGCGRVLSTSDEMAIAVLKNLSGYVVGEGGEYAVKPKLRGQELELVAEVQRFVDEFVEANDLEDCGETDVLLTSVIDGDCLEALVARGSYAPEVELIGAETIMEPQNYREVEDYIGEVGLNWRFGVASLPGRPQKVQGYFAARQDGDWDYFAADESVFTKRNAPKQCKRGVSDFYAPYKRITRGAKLFDYSVMGATIQASIAYIKEAITGTPQSGLEGALDARLRRDVSAARGDGSVVSVTGMDTLPGRILNVAGTKYHAGPMGSPQGPLYMDVYQAVARRVGSRWQMPEYMISGDASNANYASTLAAESPFVKAMKGEQGGLAKSRKELIWKAIAIAAKHGRFGGMTTADLFQRVVVEVTYPSVEVRDPVAQEQVFDSQQAAGVLSVKTRAAKSGLDYEDELANGAKEKQENPLAGLMGGGAFPGQARDGDGDGIVPESVKESLEPKDGDGDGLINDGKPDEGPAPTHRTNFIKFDPNKDKRILFANDGNEGYGPHVFRLDTDLPHVTSDEKLISLAMEFSGLDREQAIEQIDPANIVDSARLWDDGDFVGVVWEQLGSVGYETSDGAVVLDRYSVKMSYANAELGAGWKDAVPMPNEFQPYKESVGENNRPAIILLRRDAGGLYRTISRHRKTLESLSPYALAAKLLWEGYEAPHGVSN